MAAAASNATGGVFTVFRLGTLDELARKIVEAKASDPTAESNVYAPFQLMQYTHNMVSGRAKLDGVDNDRYPGLTWTRVEDLLAARAKEASGSEGR